MFKFFVERLGDFSQYFLVVVVVVVMVGVVVVGVVVVDRQTDVHRDSMKESA